MTSNILLTEIYHHFGSYRKLALALGVSHSAVSKWVHNGRVPVKRAIQIEEKTNGLIKREFIRPDIFTRKENGANHES